MLKIVTSLIIPRDKVQLYDIESDQVHISVTTVGCILSKPKYHMLKLQGQTGLKK